MSSYAGFLKAPLLPYISYLPDDILCNVAICADDTSLYFNCDQASDLWQQLELASELEFDLRDTVEKLNWFCLVSLITLVLLM